jgi:cytosine/adenosine deaminase-related metal-dependent hydrolase
MVETTRRYRLRTARGAEIDVDGSRLQAPAGSVAMTVELDTGVLRPGLINAHDHLQLNHFPRLGTPPYANAYEWGRAIHAGQTAAIARASAFPRDDAYLFGALKNLLGGVTSVVHHDPWVSQLNGTLPIRIIRLRVAHSLGFEKDMAAARAGNAATQHLPFSMHLAEGTDDIAAGEVAEASRLGLLNEDLIAVHLVGAKAADLQMLRDAGAAAVWCPTTNQFLLHRTAPAELFDGRIDILMGTDSLLTADGTMLEELRTAASLGYLSREQLEDAVGRVAARRLGVPAPTLDPGAPADLVMLRRPLGHARPEDVALVIHNGVPSVGDEAFAHLFDYCGVPTESLRVGSSTKRVIAPLGAVARRAVELTPDVARIFN